MEDNSNQFFLGAERKLRLDITNHESHLSRMRQTLESIEAITEEFRKPSEWEHVFDTRTHMDLEFISKKVKADYVDAHGKKAPSEYVLSETRRLLREDYELKVERTNKEIAYLKKLLARARKHINSPTDKA